MVEKRIKGKVLLELKGQAALPEEEIRSRIVEEVLKDREAGELSLAERQGVIRRIFQSLCRYDVISDLLEDPEVTEIMINGPGSIFTERQGQLVREVRAFESAEGLENIIQSMVGRMDRIVNRSRPIADVRLPQGSRVSVVLPPVAPEGPVVTIRKFRGDFLEMGDLIRLGTLNKAAADLLASLVASRWNIFISGGTSSGKTTFLNLLAGFIPKEERIITIEDSAELSIPNIPNLVRLEARGGNLEGGGAVSLGDLIRAALRMRPDRIIVGEVRGGEAADMLTAMNTGHEGSLSTGHANSAGDMLLRLEAMLLSGGVFQSAVARRLIRSALDLVVHLSREGGRRLLQGIWEVEKEGQGLGLRPLMLRDSQGELVPVGSPGRKEGKGWSKA